MGNNTSSSGGGGGQQPPNSGHINNTASRSHGSTASSLFNSTSASISQHHLTPSLPSFRRSTGSLGLSKSELDKRCKPSGLYPTTPWDDKAIRRLIGDGKLASRLRGSESRIEKTDRECPICFLHYSQVNITACCKALICTECYLQVRPQKDKMVCCPFCNSPKLQVSTAKDMEEPDVEQRDSDEQVVIEGLIRKQAAENTPLKTPPCDSSNSSTTTPPSSTSSFGSSLSQSVTPMTPAQRAALEEEMKKQHSHPLARRMEQEADVRRQENELQYRRNGGGRWRGSAGAALLHRHLMQGRRGRGRRERDWNQIVEAFENDLGTQVQSLDDLVVLEAAFLLSMDEEAQRRRHDYNETTTQPRGFPLLQALLRRSNGEEAEEDSGGDEEGVARRGRRRGRGRGGDGFGGSAAAASAGLLMRGVSEEEQIAMAIAMSLREQPQQGEGGEAGEADAANNGDDGGEGNAVNENDENDNNDNNNGDNDDDETGDGPSETSTAAPAPAPAATPAPAPPPENDTTANDAPAEAPPEPSPPTTTDAI